MHRIRSFDEVYDSTFVLQNRMHTFGNNMKEEIHQIEEIQFYYMVEIQMILTEGPVFGHS